MAGFCAKCGAPHSSDTGFCSACGAPIAAAASTQPVAVPPPSATPPPVAYAPAAVLYAAPPPQKSGSALKVILIIIAVVVGLGVIGVGVAGYVGYRVLHKAGVSFSTGSGAAVSNADLGVDPYPGASRVDNGSARAKVGNNVMVTSQFTSGDSVDSVVKFYQDKLGANTVVTQTGRGTTLQSASVSGGMKNGVVITVAPGPLGGGSKIMILHEETTTP
jgi:hypothetical protein